jgi:hydrogenase maturation protein HypF
LNKIEHPIIDSKNYIRIGISLTGLVQGVGFRPHVYRLARNLHLCGWVINTSRGVTIELEGEQKSVDQFLPLLESELPPHATILSKSIESLDAIGEKDFRIKESQLTEEIVPLILPDIAVCPECLEEMFDPANRRYRYPFINCTHCGPRFSIVQSLPYDRPNTTMSAFQQCTECLREYENPENRRFHAQPNACPHCGPKIDFHNLPFTNPLCSGEDALHEAIDSLRRGKILALKGLGGFQLIVSAENENAVQLLRKRKRRGNKPFALMFPDIVSAQAAAHLSEPEQRLLESSEAPIVLVEKKTHDFEASAPGNPYLGIFLPSTPLHHLLLNLFAKPLIVTSGNLRNEPICIDNNEAFARLGNIADAFLVHNRPIQRPVDDSVVRIIAGKLQILRRARGYAPLPIEVNQDLKPTLAVGGHLKSTIAIGKNNKIILSQHIGNLDTKESVRVFESTNSDFQKLYGLTPKAVVHDKHPDYYSTQSAQSHFSKVEKQSIQHHIAHVFSGMAEHSLSPPVLGISWDGTGYGDDGKIWGAESFLLSENKCQRIASILPFQLPGGESAIIETSRIATSLLYEAGCETGKDEKTGLFVEMIRKGVHAPVCSSMGRLFDGVSALLGLCERVDYEGEAAMLLEFEAQQSTASDTYSYPSVQTEQQGRLLFDWRPMIRQIQCDLKASLSPSDIARKFHHTLVALILEIARLAGQEHVVLTGGCFQNKFLTELTIRELTQSGFKTYTHRQVPPNDGGLAVGQIYATLFPSILQQP